MKTILATALASLAFLGAAYAATVEGVVQAFDPATRTVTLQDGHSYVVPDTTSIEAIAVGAKIKITVDDSSGAVTAVETGS
ncbi:MAG TPA: DUF1344 domain-containing protein [Rhizobiales bacterium]|nr:DUF1344 domain-containing protein [Hyphomicrobiales bacterium]